MSKVTIQLAEAALSVLAQFKDEQRPVEVLVADMLAAARRIRKSSVPDGSTSDFNAGVTALEVELLTVFGGG